MSRRRSRYHDPRGLAVTSAGSIARGYVSGSRHDLDRDGAIAAIRAAARAAARPADRAAASAPARAADGAATSDDADILAEAAAVYAVPHAGQRDPCTDGVVEILFAAGADPAAFDRHCQARREEAKRPRFDLATFADQQNHPPST